MALHTLTHRYQLEVKNGASHQDSIPLVGIYLRHSTWRQRFYKSREAKEIFIRLSSEVKLQELPTTTSTNRRLTDF